MAIAVGRIGHEDRLSAVDHLEELRARLIVCLVAIGLAFGVCVWQNHALLRIINRPLTHQTQKQVQAGNGPLGATYTVQQNARIVATQLELVVSELRRPGSGATAATRASLDGVGPKLQGAIAGLSAPAQGDKPVTLGIGEPFVSTMGIALIFAVVLALPVVLYELYGFLLPAFSPDQQRAATPVMVAIPLLFVLGVAFGYFVVLPAAVRFFCQLQQLPVQRARTGQPVLPLRRRYPAGDGTRLSGSGRNPRGHPRRDHFGGPAPGATAATHSWPVGR
jgi:sec-independent protein translocase protein TatC